MTQLIPATAHIAGGFTPAQEQSVIFDGGASLSKSTINENDLDTLTINTNFYLSEFGTARYILGGTNGSDTFNIFLDSSDRINVGGGASNAAGNLISTQVFRDVGWYNLHVVYASGEATSSNRLTVEINKEQITDWSTETYPTLNNDNALLSSGGTLYIGANNSGTPSFEGGMSDFNFIPGSVSSSVFTRDINFGGGSITTTKAPSGVDYGEGGFRLTFSNSSDFGEDDSSNGNDLTPSGFSTTDQITDVPGDTFAIMNPLNKQTVVSVQEGGTRTTYAGGAITGIAMSSMPFPNYGKWYYEHTATTIGGDHHVGIHNTRSISALDGINIFAASTSTFGEEVTYLPTGNKQLAGVQSVYGATFTAGDVIGVLYDGDADTLEFFKNGVSQGVISSGISGQYSAVTMTYSGGQADINFGQKPFVYSLPVDALPLRTSSLQTPEHYGGDVLGINLRTGTGSVFSVTGSGNSTDFVWSKSRSASASYVLSDSVRGIGLNLSSDSTASEVTDAQAVTSFDVDGFSGGTSGTINTSSRTYVDWMLKAGGSSVSNTDGTITSQVSVAPEGHFSIATATTVSAGDTYGTGIDHDLVILKDTGAATSWPVWSNTLSDKASSTQRNLFLNTTASQSGLINTYFREMDNSLVTVGSDGAVLGDIVSYNFKEVDGLCNIGSYEGNGGSSGPYIYCGFKPRWIMIKGVDASNEWMIYDTERDELNPNTLNLRANSSAAEVSNTDIDILSEGFKIRTSSSNINLSSTFIYIAIAEEAGGGELPWPLGR